MAGQVESRKHRGDAQVLFGRGVRLDFVSSPRKSVLMEKRMVDVLNGVLGHFWLNFPPRSLEDDAYPGYVHQDRERPGMLILNTLLSLRGLSRPLRPSRPSAITGATTEASVIVYGIDDMRQRSIRGHGTRSGSYEFDCEAIVVGVDLGNLNSTLLRHLEVHFPDLSDWSQFLDVHEDYELLPDDRPKSMTIKIEPELELTADLREGQQLKVKNNWQATGPLDRRTLYVPLAITSESDVPLPYEDHLQPLLAVQDLISLAYGESIMADGGRARIDVLDSYERLKPRRTYPWWSSRLMVGAHDTAPTSARSFPAWRFNDIGQADGLVAWVNLCTEHPRAVNPLVDNCRKPAGPVQVLLDIAVGIEYWVETWSGPLGWATSPQKGQPFNDSDRRGAQLARHVGDHFTKWVGGDSSTWAKEFHTAYNGAKHIKPSSHSTREIELLGQSGRALLECALLDHVAGNDGPSRSICDSFRNYQLGQNIRDLMQRKASAP